ncbi:hypothetical protein DFH94DRAFT_847987 [Russula ochroleuca]|uniref:NACHT domain-containing protein n=1 Tax=Russula ochroleuca TaxID=152965 RepID=A0A9P5MQU0_9AGAM|nr:hypothetical protein DFH94DRAFT_847987 [Russula ochroleuca]
MSDHLGSSHFRVLFEAALQDYEKQTGITLAKHPFAKQLQDCCSVESITNLLHEQAQAFSEFRGSDKIAKSFKYSVSILYTLSNIADLGRSINLPFPPANAIYTGLAIVLSAVKDVGSGYDALADSLESIENFLKRLELFTKIPPTAAMTEILVKILVELLSILALVTKQIKQGRGKKFVKNLFGQNDIEAVLQRLDRLTQDEARMAAVQTLEIVYGLFQNMKEVMNNGEASIGHFRDVLEIMQEITSDMNKSKRDKMQKHLQRWLSPPDPWKNHNIACESHHLGTATWFIQGNTFSEWKASDLGSLLWIHGKPGAGKSVLGSTIIQDIDAMRKAGLASLGFFYCDFREDEKKSLRGLLSSLLVQLCHQVDSYHEVLSKFYTEYANGSRDPGNDALAGCLKDLLKLPGQAPVYLIVDALDECPNASTIPSPRAKVLNFMEELIKPQFPNLRICLTSRLETDIKVVLDPLVLRSVSLHDERGQKEDINEYIKSVVSTHPENQRWKSEDKQLVTEVLTNKANGIRSVDTITSGVSSGTCGSFSHASRVPRRCVSPEQPRVDPITSGVTKWKYGSHSHADVAAQDRDGSTALHLALKWGRAAVAGMLLERGADASTPLHLASLQGHTDVVRMLLERNADAQAQNEHGSTPLDLALQGRHAKVVGILREHGVDPTAQDQQG